MKNNHLPTKLMSSIS